MNNSDLTYIPSPKKIPLLLRLPLYIAEKIAGKQLLPIRLLSWYPKAIISSSILEALITSKDKGISKRLLKLIRLQVSFIINCPFCIQMNSSNYSIFKIAPGQLEDLHKGVDPDVIHDLSESERSALLFTREMCSTPVLINKNTVKRMNESFNERQFVIIVSTVAQVNYWARLSQGFGIVE